MKSIEDVTTEMWKEAFGTDSNDHYSTFLQILRCIMKSLSGYTAERR